VSFKRYNQELNDLDKKLAEMRIFKEGFPNHMHSA